MNFVSFGNQKFGKIRAVLASDTDNQSPFCHIPSWSGIGVKSRPLATSGGNVY
jgi:hypothetical protein